MDNKELIRVHHAVEDALKADPQNEHLTFANRLLSEYTERLENANLKGSEIHRVASAEGRDLHIYLTPILDRMHVLEPTTPVKYSFGVADSGDPTLTLETEGRSFSANGDVDEVRLLRRCSPFLESYVEERKTSSGCSECGAKRREMCLENCSVLEAEILLGTIRRLTT